MSVYGDYNGKHWLTDSICLHADIFDDLALFELFSQSINDFYYYGPTRISKDDWKMLVFNAQKKESWKCVINELSFWVDNCFAKYECFTICGI